MPALYQARTWHVGAWHAWQGMGREHSVLSRLRLRLEFGIGAYIEYTGPLRGMTMRSGALPVEL